MSLLSDTYALFEREMLIFRSHLRTNIIRSLIFPIVLILFFGNVGSVLHDVPVAIVNYANNQQSASFISALESSGTVQVKAMTTQSNGMQMLYSGEIAILIVISPSFPSMSSQSPTVDLYYSQTAVTELGALSTIESAASSLGLNPKANPVSVLMSGPKDSISASAAYGGSSSYKDYIVAGIIIMVAAFGATFGGGMTMIMDRELGNLKSFLIAPINKLSVISSKILSGTFQSLIYGVIALGIGLLDGAGVAMGALGYLWIVVLVLITSLGFGGITTALAAKVRRVEVFAIFSNAVLLPLWFLSGAFFPASNFPWYLRSISVVDPMTYAVQGIRYVMIAGYYPLSAAVLDLSVLVGFAALMLALSFVMFKRTIE
ncbi:MAG: ABC transporter permease [Candidatus Micrarchaeaceae archaeon]